MRKKAEPTEAAIRKELEQSLNRWNALVCGGCADPFWADGSWELGISRVTGKIPDRANRIRCLRNAVVPQQFCPVFRAIAEVEERGKPL